MLTISVTMENNLEIPQKLKSEQLYHQQLQYYYVPQTIE